MLRFSNIKIPVDAGKEVLEQEIQKQIGAHKIIHWQLVKKAIDARSRDCIYFVYTVDVDVADEDEVLAKSPWKYIEKALPNLPLQIKKVTSSSIRPLVVGSGPAGMFAALVLAQAGLEPLIIERGSEISRRHQEVDTFWQKGKLNLNSNVQFGEGGAGTFSDGKLMTGIKKDAHTAYVLQTFVDAGAPKEILFLAKPHLGTDNLIKIVANIRKKIESLGGEYRFNTQLKDISVKDGKIVSAIVCDAAGREEEIITNAIILAIGHSARDTFEMLYKRQVPMTAKPFSVGVRIEHPQSLINKALYHKYWNSPYLGAADYKMSVHLPNGRSAYTFCMCPGGVVVAAASEQNAVVTNGMSYYARDKQNANSALLVGVTPEDFGTSHPLGGMYFQRNIEQKAFLAGHKTYQAPAQKCGDFLKNIPSQSAGEVHPSYSCGVIWGNLDTVFPDYVTETLRLAIKEMDKKLHGFNYPDAVLTGAETRSSSPFKFLRGEDNQSPVLGLYPCGEGAGFAGGIMSAAVDGIKTALNLLKQK